MEALVLEEDLLEVLDRTADGGFADAIAHADMGVSAIFTPVHQDHEQAVFQTKRRGTPKNADACAQNITHQVKDSWGSAGEAFEHFGFAVFEICVEHTYFYVNDPQDLCKRSIEFCYMGQGI